MNTPDNTYWRQFLKENDKESFSHIYKEHMRDLYAYGVSLGFAPDVCMDAIQDIFFKLYVQKNELKHVSNIRFYLFRSFKNRLLDTRKKQQNMQPLEDVPNVFSIEVYMPEQFEDEEERAILKQKVETLLSLLTDRQREVIYLRYMQNLEYDEIAMMMKMNPESVRKSVYRALEVIRKNTRDTSLPLFMLLMHVFG